MTDTVYPGSVRFHFHDKTIMTLLAFIFVSLFLHVFILYFFKFQQRGTFETNLTELKVILQPKVVNKVQPPPPSPPDQRSKANTPPKVVAPPPPVHAYELLNQSKQVIEQQIRAQILEELKRNKMYQFGESHRDERTLTPAWMKSDGDIQLGKFTIEDFQLTNGSTFVKLTFSNGRTLCYNVRPADPADVFSMAIWVVNRCRG